MPRRSWHSDGPLVAFSVGHRWATRPTYPRNRCRSKGAVAHGERSLCHAWPTHPDGAFGAVRAVHEASLHSIMGALVAPPGRQVRHRFAMYLATAGAPGSCGVPRRRRGRGATHGRHLICCPDLWEGLPAPPQPRAMARNSCLLPPAAYRQLCAMRACGSQRTAVPTAAGGPWPGMSFGAPHAPGVPTCL